MAARKKPSPSRRRKPAAGPSPRPFLPLLVFLLLSALLYGNTLGNAFVYDDKALVKDNPLIRDPTNLGRIMISGYWTFRDQSFPELYRPLTVASFAVNYLFGGSNPAGYHLVNLLLHAAVSWLVFRMGARLTGSPAVGWAAGLLFAVHPVHVEAVAPVVGRSELLAAGFGLLAFLLHRRASESAAPSEAVSWSAAGCYLAAVLAKENALVMPLIFLAGESIPAGDGGARRSPIRWRRYLPYPIVAVVYLGLRFMVLGGVIRSQIVPIDNPLVAMEGPTRLRTALVVAGKSIALLLAPWRLSADYSGIRPALGWGDPRLLLSLAAIAGGVGLATWAFGRSRPAAFGIAFFVIAYLPISNLFFPIGTIFGERLLYLPSAGFCLAAGVALAALREKSRMAAAVILGGVLVLGAVRTVSRNTIWHDDRSFVFATATDAPESAKARFNLGVFEEERKNWGAAESAYRRALELAPDWGDVSFNLGGVLAKLSRKGEAIEAYRRAATLKPDDLRFQLNLGYALYQAGRYEEAVSLYRGILKSKGDLAPVLNNLGANLLALNRPGEAREVYQKAVGVDPANVGYRLNLAQTCEAVGDPAAAEEAYRKILEQSPDNAMALRDLGVLRFRRGDAAEAGRLLRRARDRTPGGLDAEARAILLTIP